MTIRTLLCLAVLGILALGGGWYVGGGSAPAGKMAMEAGQPMFPGLTPKLKDAARVEIVYQNKITAIVLKDGRWGLADRAGYPVQDSKMHQMLTELTELRLTEARTADPDKYARLGVEDPTKADATGSLLRVIDTDVKPIVELIAGHGRQRTQGKVEEELYVRRPTEAQSWLAEGALHADHDPAQWFNRDVVNIEHGRIASVAVTRGTTKLAFGRDGDKLVLKDPAEHPKLEDYKLEDVARAFESLTFQDVRPASDPIGATVGTGVFTTSDGLTLTATVFKADKDIWVGLTATGTDKAEAEAATLSKRLSGWLYSLGSWKEKALVPELDDLKAAEKPAEPPAPAAKP
jgi:hypothetical protein